MIRGVQRCHERHAGEAVRTVLVVLPALVQHHVALILELGLGQRRQQVRHPVGFHPEGQVERVRRHDFPVVRAIGVRRPIHGRAGGLQWPKVALVVMLRPLEHQMLEQVGEAGVTRPLVLGADVIPHTDGDDWTGVIFVNEDVEPVLEGVFRVGDIHSVDSRQSTVISRQSGRGAHLPSSLPLALAYPPGSGITPAIRSGPPLPRPIFIGSATT